MPALTKLMIAVAIAAGVQLLINTRGHLVGDVQFAAKVFVAERVHGQRLDAPELLAAAADMHRKRFGLPPGKAAAAQRRAPSQLACDDDPCPHALETDARGTLARR